MRVAVIGAGAVGSYIAYRLGEEHRIKPYLFSWKNNHKPCSGLFSTRILDFIPLPQTLVENRLSSIEINFANEKIELKLKKEIFVIDRKKFDNFLFALAKRKANIARARVTKVDVKGNVYYARTRKKFDLVIACDGALSAVRRSLSLPDPDFYLGLQFFIKKKDLSKKAETWATEHGFFWKIPRGKRVEYGIMEKPETAKQKLYEFCEKFRLKPAKLHGALIPVGPIISPYEKIFLCGDAAGLCKPWSGGGIIWSFEAAEILIEQFPDLRKASLEVKKIFERRIKFYRILNKLVRKTNSILPRKIWFDPDAPLKI